MVTVHYGTGTTLELDYEFDLLAVRTQRREPLEWTPLSPQSLSVVQELRPIVRFAAAGVEVFRTGSAETRDRARAALKEEPEVRFAGRVLTERTARQPVLYTENLFLKFHDG